MANTLAASVERYSQFYCELNFLVRFLLFTLSVLYFLRVKNSLLF